MTSRRRVLTGSAALASVAVAGCSLLEDDREPPDRQIAADWTPDPGEWGGLLYDQANSLHNPHASPPTSDPAIAWEVDATRPSILVADGTVYVREGSEIRGIDADDGSEEFMETRLGGSLHRYVDGRLYDRTQEGLDALALDGTQVWDEKISYDDGVLDFIEREGYVYVITGAGDVAWHRTDTGEQAGTLDHDVSSRALANHDGTLYLTTETGVAAYDTAANGRPEQQWERSTDGDMRPVGVAASGDRVYVSEQSADGDASALAVLTADGDPVDRLGFDRFASLPALGERTYLITSRREDNVPVESEIRAYDGTDEVWSVDREEALTGLVATNDMLYAASGGVESSTLVAFDGASGDVRWEREGTYPMAAVGDTVYAATDDDRLVALRE